jgi:6,7-dimethyl-8-ribityllumazine synthase
LPERVASEPERVASESEPVASEPDQTASESERISGHDSAESRPVEALAASEPLEEDAPEAAGVEAADAEVAVAEASVGEAAIAEGAVGEGADGEGAVGEGAVAESEVGEAAVAGDAVGEGAVADGAVAEAAVAGAAVAVPAFGEPEEAETEHAEGELRIPDGHEILEGAPNGFRRTVAVVVGRFNGDITNRLLEEALGALEAAHVAKESITIVPVPGAFELPLAAMALAKTRRYACVVALGCVIRGETPHFDFVAGEAASGLQLAAIETGIPVSFGVLTCETREQAEARVGRGADAARSALEMADLFSYVRTRAAAPAG